METLIVTTDFTVSSANALDYACALVETKNYKLLLAYIYTIPITYTSDGLGMYAINDSISDGNAKLRLEQDRVQALYPGIHIETTMMMGGFLESLASLERDAKPRMIIMGALGEYSDLWEWDDDWLSALVSSNTPVLVIPSHITYKPYRHIAFACDYKRVCGVAQAAVIKDWVDFSGAQLHVVHVTEDTDVAVQERKIDLMKDTLGAMSPQYHFIQGKHVIRTIAEFVRQYDIDLLLVTPHKHGLWYNLFNKSYSKQLARFNTIPVIAIPD